MTGKVDLSFHVSVPADTSQKPEIQTKKEPKKTCNPLVAVILILILIFGALILMRLNTEKHLDTVSISPETQINQKPDVVWSRNVCESPTCLTLAHQMNNWRDHKVDPCDNFFEYACGKYAEHTDTNGPRLHEKMYLVNGQINEFLLKNKPTDSPSEKAMHLLYRKCQELKDPAIREKEGQKMVREIWQSLQKMGSWPAIDPNWDSSKFDLNELLSNFASITRDVGFLNVDITPTNIITIKFNGSLTKGAELLPNVTEGILMLNEISYNESSLNNDIADYLTLKSRLEALYLSTNNVTKLENAKQFVPSIDFDRILEKMGDLNHDEWRKVKEQVQVQFMPFLYGDTDNLEKVINSTPARVLANYPFFRFLENAYTNIDFLSLDLNCHIIVKKTIPQAVYRMLVNNHFDEENLKAAAEIVNRTKEAYVEMFRESTWLSESTRKAAIRKVQNLKRTIGHTDDYEQKSVEERFQKLDFQPSETLNSITSRELRYRQQEYLKSIASSSGPKEEIDLLEVNAWYIPLFNKFYLLSQYLDDPFFDVTLPSYAKLAVVGFIAGHEIGHGFDPFNIDGYGKLGNEWDRKDAEKYERRIQCLVNMTDEYEVPVYGRVLDGELTKGEVTADVLGVDVAWRTFKKGDYTNEPRMIGFEDQSIEKTFFHLMALDYCSPTMKPRVDPHPPGEFRVNAIYSNSKAFAEAYQCPIGSPMNPEKKCELF